MCQLPVGPSSSGLWFDYEKDTPVQPNREIRALGMYPMIKNGSVWCLTLVAGSQLFAHDKSKSRDTLNGTCFDRHGKPNRRFAVPRPTPFRPPVEYCCFSRHVRAGALKFHKSASPELHVTKPSGFKPMPRQVSESFLYAPSKLAACLLLATLLLSAYGCGLRLPERINAKTIFVNIAPNTEEIAARHYPYSVTTSRVDTREEKCRWNTSWETIEPLFTPDGENLLIDRYNNVFMDLVGFHSEFVFYDATTCRKVRSFAVAGLDVTQSLEFSNDGRYLVRASSEMHQFKAQVQQIESDTGKTFREWNYTESHSPNVGLSSDGTLLVIGLAQHKNKEDAEGDVDEHIGRVILVDFTSGDVIRDWIESETNGIASVDASSNGDVIALGFRDGTAKVLQWRLEAPATIVQHTGVVDKLMISPDDSLVFLRSSKDAKRLVAHQLGSGEQIHEFEFEGPIHDFDISSDSKTLVVGAGSTIEIVDLDTES